MRTSLLKKCLSKKGAHTHFSYYLKCVSTASVFRVRLQKTQKLINLVWQLCYLGGGLQQLIEHLLYFVFERYTGASIFGPEINKFQKS